MDTASPDAGGFFLLLAEQLKTLIKSTFMPVFIRLVYATYLRYSAFATAKSVAGICTPDVTTSIYILYVIYRGLCTPVADYAFV